MHKPVRPKSAKGKTRPARIVQRSALHSNENGEGNASSSSAATSRSYRQQETITSAYTAQQHNIRNQSTVSASKLETQEEALSSVPSFPEITRPTSSLSKYRVLPSISGSPVPSSGDATKNYVPPMGSMHEHFSEMNLLSEQAQQMILDSSIIQRSFKQSTPPQSTGKRKVVKHAAGSGENKRQKTYQTQSVFSSSQKPLAKEPPKPKVPREPGPTDERLLLALKLPDGSRVERYFRPKDRLMDILAYAHSQYPMIPISQCNLYRMDTVPKQLLKPIDMTISQAGIQHRTVLYVEEVDEDV